MIFILNEQNIIIGLQVQGVVISHLKVELDDDVDADLISKINQVIGFVVLNSDKTFPDNWYETALIEKQEAALEKSYSAKTKLLHKNADALAAQYLTAFSDIERETFSIQKEELAAYQLSTAAATPFLDGLASTRGIDRDVMMGKVATAITSLKAVSGAIVAQQQHKEDELKAAYELKNTFSDSASQLQALDAAVQSINSIDVSISV